MESSYKTTNLNGTTTATNDHNTVADKISLRSSDFLVRFLAVVATLVAVIVMGVGKQTKIIVVTVVPTLPPLNVPMHAKWQYSSAMVFFMVVNIIACIYGALNLILAIGNRFKGLDLTVIILDLIMLALLFAGNGAAAAVGVIGYKGNSHTRWNKVCNVFDSYCRHAAASIALSLIGSLMFLLLLVLATSRLHKRSH